MGAFDPRITRHNLNNLEKPSTEYLHQQRLKENLTAGQSQKTKEKTNLLRNV